MSQMHPQPVPGAITCVWATLPLSTTELLNGSPSSRLSPGASRPRSWWAEPMCCLAAHAVINASGGSAPRGGLS